MTFSFPLNLNLYNFLQYQVICGHWSMLNHLELILMSLEEISSLQYTSVHLSPPQYTTAHSSKSQYTAVHLNTPQYISVHRVHCSALQFTSVNPSTAVQTQYRFFSRKLERHKFYDNLHLGS